PLRVKIHTAPIPASSKSPPTAAVLPSADSATEMPSLAAPPAPVPTNFEPCCVHAEPLRTKIHAAPTAELSAEPPPMAVLPSADSATEAPWPAAPPAAVPTDFEPCCLHLAPPRTNTHAAPAHPSSDG